MDMIGKVRRMKLRDQLSLSEIAKRTGLSRNTVKKWLKAPSEVVPKYERGKVEGKLTAFEPTLHQSLTTDSQGVASAQVSTVTKWRDKLRVIPHTLNKVPAPINPDIQATIYTGLLNERQLQVTYRAITTGKEAKTYPVHPLGLVVMEQVVYSLTGTPARSGFRRANSSSTSTWGTAAPSSATCSWMWSEGSSLPLACSTTGSPNLMAPLKAMKLAP